MECQLVFLCAVVLLQCHAFPVLQDETTTLRIRQTSELDNWEKDQPSILSIFKRSTSTSRGSDNVEGEDDELVPSITTKLRSGANEDSVQEILTKANEGDSTLTKERPEGRMEETATSVNNKPINFMKRSAEGGTGDAEEDCDETEELTDENQDEKTTDGEATDESGGEETTDEQAVDEETTDEQETDEETTDEQAVDEETTDEQETDEETTDEQESDEETTDEQAVDEETTEEEATDDPEDNREGGTPEADPDWTEKSSTGDTAQDDNQNNSPAGSDDQGSAVDEESSPAGEHSNNGSSDDAHSTVDCSDDQQGGAEVEPSADYQEGVDDGFSADDCPDDIDRAAGDQSSSKDEHEGQMSRSVDYQSDQGGEDTHSAPADGGGNPASDDDDPRVNQEATDEDGDEKWMQKDAEGGEDTAEEELPVYGDQNTDGRWIGGQLEDCSEYQDQDGDRSWRERRETPSTTTHAVVIPASVVQQIVRTDSNPAVSSTLVQKSAVLGRVDTPQVPVTSAVQPVPEDLKEGLKQLRQEIQHFEEKASKIKEPPGGAVTDLGLKPVV